MRRAEKKGENSNFHANIRLFPAGTIVLRHAFGDRFWRQTIDNFGLYIF
jgi:hypothetical protein